MVRSHERRMASWMDGWMDGRKAGRQMELLAARDGKKNLATLYGSLVPSGESLTLTSPHRAP